MLMKPDSEDLWFLPLGGCGEIGMNFNVYGHDGKWLIIDCGLTFNDAPADNNNHRSQRRCVQMADPAFIAAKKDDIVGMIITHAHEDHIGAVQYLWPQLECPIFTTAFTAAILQRKLAETSFLSHVPVRVVDSSDCIDIGPFNVEWISKKHSVPEPHSQLIKTSAG
ncbi:MAG: MBL fold metallo-hydrolase, partial [Pseudomonadota bacterium]